MDAVPTTARPYPGLRPFRSDEAEIFFGRERQTDELLARLQRHRLVAVAGPSGCGKSSLVRAGLIPALHAGFMAGVTPSWRSCQIRPGQRPIAALAEALAAPEVFGIGPEDAPPSASIEAALRFGSLGLAELVRECPIFRTSSLFLLVDQFEEVFRFRERIDPNEADAFVALLLAAASDPSAPIYVVLTMRSDYLGECALFHGLPEAISRSQYLTPRLTRDECAAAILGPARVHGGFIDPPLVNRLLNDFGPDPDQLPLLQHALMRMWTRYVAQGRPRSADRVALALDDYEAVGGIARALSAHADEVLDELSREGTTRRRVAEILFRRLTERTLGRRDSRAPARLGEVAAIAQAPEGEVATVVERFRGEGRNFITPADGPLESATVLDIGHESLIRQWDTLARWVDEEARSAAVYRRLLDTAALWREGKAGLWRKPDLGVALAWERGEHPDPNWAARYSREGDLALALEFLRASEADDTAVRAREREREDAQRQHELARIKEEARLRRLEAEANAARADAEAARAEAEAARRARARATSIAISAAGVALLAAVIVSGYVTLGKMREVAQKERAAHERLEMERGVLTQKNDALKRNRAALERAVVALASATDPQAVRRAFAKDDGASEAVSRVYVHVRSEAERSVGQAVSEALRANGFVVPPVQRDDSGPTGAEVRSFRQQDGPEAMRIAAVMRTAGLPRVTVNQIHGSRTSPRTFEIWISAIP